MSRLKPSRRPDTSAVRAIDRLFNHAPGWDEAVEEARTDSDVAHAIYDLRTQNGLTQQQLADRIGTTQSVIARLEDADYEGHSLARLRRVARAFDRKLDLTFTPLVPPVPRVGEPKAASYGDARLLFDRQERPARSAVLAAKKKVARGGRKKAARKVSKKRGHSRGSLSHMTAKKAPKDAHRS